MPPYTFGVFFAVFNAPISATVRTLDGFDQPDHGGSVSEPDNGSAERDQGEGSERVLRGVVAGVGPKDPVVRLDVGLVSAGEGLALQDGETPALKLGELLAWVSVHFFVQ